MVCGTEVGAWEGMAREGGAGEEGENMEGERENKWESRGRGKGKRREEFPPAEYWGGADISQEKTLSVWSQTSDCYNQSALQAASSKGNSCCLASNLSSRYQITQGSNLCYLNPFDGVHSRER